MKLFSLLLHSLLSITAVYGIGTLNGSNAIESAYAVKPNATTTLGAPDPRFSVTALFQGQEIPLISYLMNTVKMLGRLALEDFEGYIDPSSWDFRDYPEIGIDVPPRKDRRPIKRQHVIWGLSFGVVLLLGQNRLETATFTMWWDGREVGTIVILLRAIPSITSTATLPWATQDHSQLPPWSGTQASIIDRGPVSSANAKAWVNNDRLTIQIVSLGSSLELVDVFLLIISVLVDVASSEADERIAGYDSPGNVHGVKIKFVVPALTMKTTPAFENQWLIRAMTKLPESMIKQGTFKEVLMRVYVDGERVADGFLEKATRIDDGRLAALNMSVS